jgi:tripartite-type tricarboxylate transporter receptor subunit TctC
VDLMCDLTANALPYIQSGQVRALAVTTSVPLAGTALAQVPTTTKFGMPDAELSVWFSMYAPRGTPTATLKKINDAVTQAMRDATFMRAQSLAGQQIVTDARRTPEGHRAFLRKESARWIPLIRAAGAYAD